MKSDTLLFLFCFLLFWQPTLAAQLPAGVSRASDPADQAAASSQAPHTPPWLSLEEFKSLAEELSHKVNLFRDVWKLDPSAEFYGGTSRDFLYWLKGEITSAKTREEFDKKKSELLESKTIDVRDFVIGQSDVDIITKVPHAALSAEAYGVRKIDFIDGSRFDEHSAMGQTELKQGYIPVEKIRLGSSGLIDWRHMGDGAAEIYSGVPTLHMAPMEDFKATHYARQSLNHPVLLAIRFIRILAINYFKQHGAGLPNEKLLLDIDPASERQLRTVMEQASRPGELIELLAQIRSKTWANQSIQKIFRSYTNPTAAYMLAKRFGLDKLVAEYSDDLEPINQYLFAKNYPKADLVRERLAAYGVTPDEFFIDPMLEFPDSTLFHGTRTDESFTSILLQGILPSTNGVAGQGLYAVEKGNISFAEMWGGDPDRVVKFNVKPTARVVDVTNGAGQKIFGKFGYDYDRFADYFGIDIIKYPYSPAAYVVKNSEILERPQGHKRQVLTLSKFLERARGTRNFDEIQQLLKAILVSRFSSEEITVGLSSIPNNGFQLILKEFLSAWDQHREDLERFSPLKLDLLQLILAYQKPGATTKKQLAREKKQLLAEMDAFAVKVFELSETLPSASKIGGLVSVLARCLLHGSSDQAQSMPLEMLKIRLRKYPRAWNLIKGWVIPLAPLFLFDGMLAVPTIAEFMRRGEIRHPDSLVIMFAMATFGGVLFSASNGHFKNTRKEYKVRAPFKRAFYEQVKREMETILENGGHPPDCGDTIGALAGITR